MRDLIAFLLALYSGLSLAGCTYAQPPSGVPARPPSLEAPAAATASQGYLYVSNAKGASVTEYAPGGTRMLRSIRVSHPGSLALDPSNTLFVVNGAGVNVYPSGSSVPERTLSSSTAEPFAVAVLGSSKVYAAFGNKYGFVNVYGPGGTPLLNTIPANTIDALQINRSGNVYVDLFREPTITHSIFEYTPTGKFLTSIPGSMWGAFSEAMAVDSHNNFYAAYTSLGRHISEVDVYRGNSATALRVIPANWPTILALDPKNNLYISGPLGGPKTSITEYAPGNTKLLRTITDGISNPLAMATDSDGTLYVANAGNNSITVYAPGSTNVLRRITKGIDDPVSLAIGLR
jgi:hypothetical protein